MSEPRLTHLDADGARMVDVGGKPITRRRAVAEARVRISKELAAAIAGHALTKGAPFEVARIAGIQAAKDTPRLIPLCHTVPLERVEVRLELGPDYVRLESEVVAEARTGVEMEALTAVTVAALTLIDMGKAVDRGMVIERVRLREKTGGRRGDYHAPEDEP